LEKLLKSIGPAYCPARQHIDRRPDEYSLAQADHLQYWHHHNVTWHTHRHTDAHTDILITDTEQTPLHIHTQLQRGSTPAQTYQ